MMALEWRDVDLHKRQLCVQRSDWKGHVTVPKGGRLRYVPLTIRLATALREHRHLRSERVLCQLDGSPMSADIVKHHVERAARRAQIAQSGVHRLRHSFCSHLAMRGAPARAIQELAGARRQLLLPMDDNYFCRRRVSKGAPLATAAELGNCRWPVAGRG
jgi:integrase